MAARCFRKTKDRKTKDKSDNTHINPHPLLFFPIHSHSPTNTYPMTYIKQIAGEMRRQPVIGAVTLIGTALAIFLIMIVVMMQEVKVAPIAPESNRDRFLHARFFHRENLDGNGFGGSGTMSYQIAKRLYNGLEHTDTTAFFINGTYPLSAGVHGKTPIRIDMRNVDAAYWRVFDFTFIDGKPFTAEDVDAHLPKCIITESMARELFGTPQATGKDFNLDYFTTVTVSGVVKDVPTVTSLAYAQAWMPLKEEHTDGRFMGPIHATILAKDKSDFQAIKQEVDRRVDALNAELKSEGFKMADHDAPYPQVALPLMRYSNVTPDYESSQRQRWLIYTILLIIPAINLSSMTQSRLRQRVSEIGVRRAFGCTRLGIMRDILAENLMITIAGGLLGFLFSVTFAWIAADSLFASHHFSHSETGVTPWMLLDGNVFIFALGFCFILNLLTASIPAWRASRLNPVEAIGGLHK